jgi:hypothetical protein
MTKIAVNSRLRKLAEDYLTSKRTVESIDEGTSEISKNEDCETVEVDPALTELKTELKEGYLSTKTYIMLTGFNKSQKGDPIFTSFDDSIEIIPPKSPASSENNTSTYDLEKRRAYLRLKQEETEYHRMVDSSMSVFAHYLFFFLSHLTI